MRIPTLGEICEFKPSKRLARASLTETDAVSFVPMNDLGIHQKFVGRSEERPLSEVIGSYTYFAEGDVLLAKITPCFENGKLGVARELTNGVGFGSSEFIVIRPSDQILAEYLYYFLDRDEVRLQGAKVMTGAVGHKRVPQEFVEALSIPLPPLEEQRRIVAVLDEAFAAIATATANAEKNLANVRELLFTAICAEFENSDESWKTRPFEDCIAKLKYPAKIQRREFQSQGAFPIISQEADFINGYWDDPKDVLKVTSPLLVFGDHTQVLKYVDFDFVIGADGVKLLLPYSFLDARFLFYFLKANPMESKGYARHFRHLKSLAVPTPEIAEQKQIAARLDEIAEEVSALEAVFLSKLQLLNELKQSLLHRAFTGELTTSAPDLVTA